MGVGGVKKPTRIVSTGGLHRELGQVKVAASAGSGADQAQAADRGDGSAQHRCCGARRVQHLARGRDGTSSSTDSHLPFAPERTCRENGFRGRLGRKILPQQKDPSLIEPDRAGKASGERLPRPSAYRTSCFVLLSQHAQGHPSHVCRAPAPPAKEQTVNTSTMEFASDLAVSGCQPVFLRRGTLTTHAHLDFPTAPHPHGNTRTPAVPE